MQNPQLPNRPFQFAVHFLKIYRWPLMVMALMEFGQAACSILMPDAFKKMIDVHGLHFHSGSVYQDYKSPILYFLFLNLGVLLFSRTSGTILIYLSPALRRRVRHDLYHYLQFHSQRFFSSHFAGALANRISEVSMSVNHSIWSIMFDFWPTLVTFCFSMSLLYKAHKAIGGFFSAWVFVYVLISYILATRARVYAKEAAAARSTVSGKIVDAVTNIMNTKIFTQLEFERKHLRGYLDYEVNTARKTFWFMEKMRWFQFIATLFLLVTIVLYSLDVLQKGQITAGEFTMITTLALLVINDARNLSRRFLEFFEYIGNINDGVSIMITPHDILDTQNAQALSVSRGELEFKDVTFEYSEGKKVFDRLNIQIQAGQKVGLVGFSGSGKSTFMNLILRLYELQGGKILIDEQNIRDVTQDTLRASVSVIPQEPMLFHRSLMENIRYGRLSATDEEVIQAAKLAHAHDFIIEKSEQYQSLVGERGIKLSGGQRQRIAIARAFLKDASIILMDEATSSLDSYTEKLIQQSLQKLMKDRTVLIIAHRLSTISQLDRIIVFHEGKIIEDGTHDALIAQNGHYAKLWRMQAGGFLPTDEDLGLLKEEVGGPHQAH